MINVNRVKVASGFLGLAQAYTGVLQGLHEDISRGHRDCDGGFKMVCLFKLLRELHGEEGLYQKNPRTHKNKIGTPPQKKTLKGDGDGFFPAERTHFPGAHKIGAAISGPRIADKQFCRHEADCTPTYVVGTVLQPSHGCRGSAAQGVEPT